MIDKLNPYLKFIASLVTAAGVDLEVAFPHASWLPVVPAVLGALTVYGWPNTPPAAKP